MQANGSTPSKVNRSACSCDFTGMNTNSTAALGSRRTLLPELICLMMVGRRRRVPCTPGFPPGLRLTMVECRNRSALLRQVPTNPRSGVQWQFDRDFEIIGASWVCPSKKHKHGQSK